MNGTFSVKRKTNEPQYISAVGRRTKIIFQKFTHKTEKQLSPIHSCQKEKELIEKQYEINELLTVIKESDERKGANIEGLNEFQKGLNLTAQLYRCDDGNFKIKIFKGNEINDYAVCEEMNVNDFSVQKFNDIIKSYEYTTEDAVLFELIYNNEENGSYHVISYLDNVIDETKETYKYLYSRKLKIN